MDLDFTANADGSVLVGFGGTRVLCTAFLEEKVPPFLKGQRRGWVTAEYGMLPGSTHTRTSREAARGKQSGRTVEISRLIGRSLRTCVDMERLGENTVTIDCDVLQADGGTRTTAITGGYMALALCLWKHRGLFKESPLIRAVAAISVGIVDARVVVDLDYLEDSSAETDLNLIMSHEDKFVEIQGTAEKEPFSFEALSAILEHGRAAIRDIIRDQRQALIAHGVETSWLP